MATQRITLESTAVDKMFPVSFEREGKYDRVLSEENLTSWIRGLLPNSADDSKNSPSSYMITPVIPDNFAQSNSDGKSEYIEFIIGGYYVKLSGSCLEGTIDTDSAYDIYARITRSNSLVFKQLNGSVDAPNFTYVELYRVDADDQGVFQTFSDSVATTLPSNPGTISADSYHLHILRKEAGSDTFIIPTSSLSIYNVIDGGEI